MSHEERSATLAPAKSTHGSMLGVRGRELPQVAAFLQLLRSIPFRFDACAEFS